MKKEELSEVMLTLKNARTGTIEEFKLFLIEADINTLPLESLKESNEQRFIFYDIEDSKPAEEWLKENKIEFSRSFPKVA